MWIANYLLGILLTLANVYKEAQLATDFGLSGSLFCQV